MSETMKCECCGNMFPVLCLYHREDREVLICDDCRNAIVKNIVEQSSRDFVEIVFKWVRKG